MELLFKYSKLIFAGAFLLPLFSQTLVALEVPLPGGVSPFVVGGLLALVLGVQAQIRGRWI